MRTQQYLWMAVTADEYELPLIVENTAAALGRKAGSHWGYRQNSGIPRKKWKVQKNEKRTDAGLWNPVQGPESGGKTVERLTIAYERKWVDESVVAVEDIAGGEMGWITTERVTHVDTTMRECVIARRVKSSEMLQWTHTAVDNTKEAGKKPWLRRSWKGREDERWKQQKKM